jgi:hypothetical protein
MVFPIECCFLNRQVRAPSRCPPGKIAKVVLKTPYPFGHLGFSWPRNKFVSLGITVVYTRIWGYERAYARSYPQIRTLSRQSLKNHKFFGVCGVLAVFKWLYHCCQLYKGGLSKIDYFTKRPQVSQRNPGPGATAMYKLGLNINHTNFFLFILCVTGYDLNRAMNK